MAPSRFALEQSEVLDKKCSIPIIDFDHDNRIVYYDPQAAEPGTFIVPGVIDVEKYKPGSIAEFSWIYFKGDPQAGSQPGHPFELPFDNRRTNFTLDLVYDDSASSHVRQIMRTQIVICRCSVY